MLIYFESRCAFKGQYCQINRAWNQSFRLTQWMKIIPHMIRSYYQYCCINEPVIFSHCVHLKLGRRFHALLLRSWQYCPFKQCESYGLIKGRRGRYHLGYSPMVPRMFSILCRFEYFYDCLGTIREYPGWPPSALTSIQSTNCLYCGILIL